MLKIPSLVFISLSIAFLGGVYTSLFALEATSGFGSLSVNGWTAYPTIQSTDADPYAKAHRAKDAQILLGRAEGIQFETDQDLEGDSLRPSCNYRIMGQMPPAMFWTLRVTYPEQLSENLPKDWPQSINSHKAIYDQNNRVDIAIASKAQPGNWLAVAPNNRFKLVLTLIDTPVSNASGIRQVLLPKISKAGCR